MSIETTISRITTIRQALSDPSALLGSTGGVEAPAATGTATTTSATAAAAPFEAALAQAQAGYGATSGYPSSTALEPLGAQQGAGLYGTSGMQGLQGAPGGTGGGIVAAAESQIGQSEQPPGSNEGPAIAAYREATAGAAPGEPWCAYFASWAARQAGEPIGAAGEGLGSVSAIWSWAQGAGRAVANGPGVVPKPGDLIVFGGEHVGIVRGVLPDGRIATIEGNYENKVSANVRSAGEATGYVSMS
ncbi:MAG TPA: CHAP domain-containing protein [Solirubrobacteraceae bacterium]|nr:CHAP domain-containing protein [Solirubrobacteraceae bacterium]